MNTCISTVTLNAALDHTLYFPKFQVGQLNRVENERTDPAGKGINVAKVIKALGNDVAVTGFLGRGNIAPFENYFISATIKDHFIKLEGSTRINMKVVDESKSEVTEINFNGVICKAPDLTALEEEVKRLAAGSGLFVFAGSLPQGVPTDIYGHYIKMLHNYGCKVFLDTSGQALTEGIKAIPFAIKPNISELRQMVGRTLTTRAEVCGVVDELLAGGIEQVIVSLGAEGALIASKKECWLAQPPKVQVRSTVGAGDAMVGGLAVGEIQNLPLPERIRLATATAAASVMQPGTQVCSISDVKDLMPQVQIEEYRR